MASACHPSTRCNRALATPCARLYHPRGQAWPRQPERPDSMKHRAEVTTHLENRSDCSTVVTPIAGRR
jgi:hypothetical protein